MIGSRKDRMGSRNDLMDSSRDNSFSSRDMMGGRDMLSRRSLSVSNSTFGGINGRSEGISQSDHNVFSRSMSYKGIIGGHSNMGGGSTSPPGPSVDGMQIGTWNEGKENNTNNSNFPPVSHFEIGTSNVNGPGSRTFASSSSFNHMNGAPQSNYGPIQPGEGIRETGIIEKLLHSYGFIQCCDRQARLYFHFSQFDGNIEHFKIGDPVEFEMTYSRKSGKPIAISVSKIAPEVVMSEERVIGTVMTEVKIAPDGSESQGRISYENRGECFFLPFNISDVEGNVTLASGDKVSFQMATVQRSGNLAAKTIRLENPAASKYQGVVNSFKDTFGFIERVDVVKEIFFHISEIVDGKEEDNSHIQLGDDVEFSIQTRNGKEVAFNLTKLVSGRLGSSQKGYVAALKDVFGFIETLEHNKEIFFHFSNVEGKAEVLEVGQEVEYSIYSREKGGKVSTEGVNVKPLSKGSLPKLPCKDKVLNGKVTRPLRSVNPDQAVYCGLIVAKSNNGTILGEYEFGIASLLNKKELLQEGDPVNFQVSQNENFALNVKSNKQKLRSHVESVKCQSGFLSYEQEKGKKLFFHMSEVEGGEILQVGDEVEFVVVTNQRARKRKHTACCVRKLFTSQRPERLISKLKTMNIEEVARGGPRVTVIRQPKGPDGTKGFIPRVIKERSPAVFMDLMAYSTVK